MNGVIKKLQKYIDAEIEEIEADERYHYEDAAVQINAPLALIQVSLKSRMRMLKDFREVLDKSI